MMQLIQVFIQPEVQLMQMLGKVVMPKAAIFIILQIVQVVMALMVNFCRWKRLHLVNLPVANQMKYSTKLNSDNLVR